MEEKKITFKTSKALAKKFKTKLVAKDETAQEVLNRAMAEYVK